jgi:hypothetical protein
VTPAPTVTVRAFSSSEIWSRRWSEIWFCVLSAIVLKEWRVPRARSLAQLLTAWRTSSMEPGVNRRLVL